MNDDPPAPGRARIADTARMTPLQALRIFGPCPVSTVARRSVLGRASALTAVSRLCVTGHAERLADDSYDLTAAGREAFASAGRQGSLFAAEASR